MRGEGDLRGQAGGPSVGREVAYLVRDGWSPGAAGTRAQVRAPTTTVGERVAGLAVDARLSAGAGSTYPRIACVLPVGRVERFILKKDAGVRVGNEDGRVHCGFGVAR